MKKNKFAFILAALSFFMSSCSKDGPAGPAGTTGPAGPTGSTGPAGPTGATGTANVIYGAWVAEPSNWGADTTMLSLNGGIAKRFVVSAPALTQTILDQGIILCYVKSGVTSGNPVLLPYFLPLTGAVPNNLLALSFRAALSKIVYIFYLGNNAFVAPLSTNFNSTAQFRYILIPGGVAGRNSSGKKTTFIQGKTYTEKELKEMPYAQLCSLLKINP